MCRLAFSNLPKVVVSEAERESFERASKEMYVSNEEALLAEHKFRKLIYSPY